MVRRRSARKTFFSATASGVFLAEKKTAFSGRNAFPDSCFRLRLSCIPLSTPAAPLYLRGQMTLSYNWLMDYLPEPIALPELCTILTRIGLEVEGTESMGEKPALLEHFVVGKVEACIPHPNAERLKITTVNTGEGTRQIVCGAPNVHEGATVIVALPGAQITPGEGAPFTIKKSKLRGEVSEGMLCSAAEIGVGDDASGLLLLDEKYTAGTPAADCFSGNDHRDTAIYIGLTPNRADAASHMGTARDLCAYKTHHTGKTWQVRRPQTAAIPENIPAATLRNEAPEACLRYAVARLQNVQVGESPKWLKDRLQTIGVRSINNVVDVTNYVLHETGHPLHAFDAAEISGNEIHIRMAGAGERFTTLDGVERTLHPDDLLICDARKPVALAGVMGGKDSGVTHKTSDVLLECAVFRPATVRNSSLRHGLRSEAATHFEKGVDFDDTAFVVARALALLKEVSGAQPVGFNEMVSQKPEPKRVSLALTQVQALSGKEYSAEAVRSILKALGFVLDETTANHFTVTVPSWKTDIFGPADLVEEIVRTDGLDEIPLPETLRIPRTRQRPTDRQQKEKAARLLAGMGFHEILTNSIVNSRWYPDEPRLITMCNALSQELDALRPSMLESGLAVLEYNLNRKAENIALFEMGTVYHRGDTPNSYLETPQLALWQVGHSGNPNWKKEARPADVFTLKGTLENIFEAFGVAPETAIKDGNTFYALRGQTLGYTGLIAKEKAASFGVKEPVLFATLHWDLLMGAASASRIRFRELPRLPLVERDLSLVVDSAVAYEQLEKTTHALAPEVLQRFYLFDVFENEKLGIGKKSFAVRYHFQPVETMPTDEEIEGWMKTLVSGYEKAFGATIRLA